MLGGIYFALDTPDDFSQLQPPILGVVNMVSVLLQRKLGGQADTLQERIQKASLSPLASGSRSSDRQRSNNNAGGAAGAEAGATGQPPPLQTHSTGTGSDEGAAAAANNGGGGGGGALSVQISSLSFTSKRLNTDAIMKVRIGCPVVAHWPRIGCAWVVSLLPSGIDGRGLVWRVIKCSDGSGCCKQKELASTLLPNPSPPSQTPGLEEPPTHVNRTKPSHQSPNNNTSQPPRPHPPTRPSS